MIALAALLALGASEREIDLDLLAGEVVELELPRGSLFRWRDPGECAQVWHRTGEPPGAVVERRLRLRADDAGGEALVVPWESGTLVVRAHRPCQVHLQRADNGSGRASRWQRLESALATWAERSSQPIAVPVWADADLRLSLAELELLARVLAEADEEAAVVILRAAARRALERHRPLVAPRFVGQWVELDARPAARDHAFLVDGALTWAAPADGVARLDLWPAGGGCGRARVVAGAGAHRVRDICERMRMQVPLADGGLLRATRLTGELEVRLRFYTRRVWLAELFDERLPAAGDNVITLAAAEVHRLRDRRHEAARVYRALADDAPEPGVRAYAAWRAGSLALEDAEADLALTGKEDYAVVARVDRGLPVEHEAVRELPPAAAARALTALSRGSAPDSGRGLLLRHVLDQPHLRGHGDDLRAHDRELGRWHTWPLRGGATHVRIEALRHASEHGLVAIGRREARVLVPEDPLGLGRLRRTRVVAVAEPTSGPVAWVTIDGDRLLMPLREPVAVTAVYLAGGEHEIAGEGARLYVEGSGGRFRLRRYRDTGASLETDLPAGSEPITVSLRLWAEADADLEVCASGTCHPLHVQSGERAARVLLSLPAGARRLEIRGDPAWVRLLVRGSRGHAGSEVELAPALSPAARQRALEQLDAVVRDHPREPGLRAARAELLLAAGEIGRARRDLVRAAADDARARALLDAVGRRGLWRSSQESLEPAYPQQLLVPTADELALLDGPGLRAGDAVEAGAGPLTTWLWAEQAASADPIGAADALSELARTQTRAAALLRVRAARLRLRSDDADQWRRAYADAVAAGSVPGALTARRATAARTEWQKVPFVERAAGRAILEPGGAAHLASARTGVRVTVLGPTVVRADLRALGDARHARLTAGELVREVHLPAPVDHNARLRGSRTMVGRQKRFLLPITSEGPIRVTVATRAGSALVELAVRAPKDTADEAPRVAESPVTPPPRAPLNSATLDALAARDPMLPMTLSLTTGARTRDRDPESNYALNEPFVPLELRALRRVGDEVWLSGRADARMRQHAGTTWGLNLRCDVGVGSGPRAVVTSDTRVQEIAGSMEWSTRARADAGWEFSLVRRWNLNLRAMAGAFVRALSTERLPGRGARVDPRVYSTYARDHQRGGRARALLSWTPTADLLAQAYARVSTNADFATLDRYSAGGRVWVVVPPFYARLGFHHVRRLGDKDRFLPYSTDRLAARFGVSLWLARGQRLRVEGRERFTLPDQRHELAALVVWELSWGRGLQDLPPTLQTFRSLWTELEPVGGDDG